VSEGRKINKYSTLYLSHSQHQLGATLMLLVFHLNH